MPVTVAVRPSVSVVLGMPAPGWPTTATWSHPTWISARQRSPSFWTLATRPVTVTSRHSCAPVGDAWRTSGCGTWPVPATSTRSARRRGAPYATPIRPSARIRLPTAARPCRGRRTSMAADASWTTIRRPVESSSVAGAVTIASIATSRSVTLSARAIDDDRRPGAAEPEGVGDGEPGRLGRRRHARRRRRRGSRSGSRRARPMRVARWPTKPTTR